MKCEWPEVVGSVSRSGSRNVKGKGKVVVTSPRAGKKKHIKKSAAKVIDSNVEIVARPSDVSRSGSGHALLQCMDQLILAVENLAEAQWYTTSACVASRMAVGTLVDKCSFLGFEGVGQGEEDEEEEMDTGGRPGGGVHLSEGSGQKQTNNQHQMTTVVSGGLPLWFWYQTSSRCIVHTFG